MKEALWLDLLNSDWHDHRGSGRREDRLEDPVWLRQFLAGWGIDLSGVPEAKVKAKLRSLRFVLRQIAERAAAGKEPGPRLLKALNGFFGRDLLVRRLAEEKGRPRLGFVSVGGRLESALGEIAGSLAEILVRGDPARIKICRNRDCLWVFYDKSKNKSRKWCEEATCGNLMKVRRFRERHRRESRVH